MPNNDSAMTVPASVPALAPEGFSTVSPLQLKKDAFLQAYAVKGTVTGACKVTGLEPWQVYSWLDKDVQFQRDKDTAHQIYVDSLEATLDKGIHGDKTVNSLLIMFKLKKERPEYRDTFKIEHKGLVAVTELSTEELERIVQGQSPRTQGVPVAGQGGGKGVGGTLPTTDPGNEKVDSATSTEQ